MKHDLPAMDTPRQQAIPARVKVAGEPRQYVSCTSTPQRHESCKGIPGDIDGSMTPLCLITALGLGAASPAELSLLEAAAICAGRHHPGCNGSEEWCQGPSGSTCSRLTECEQA